MARCICLDLCAVNVNIAKIKINNPKFFAYQQYFFEPCFYLREKTFAKTIYGIMVGVVVACYKLEGNRVVSGAFYFT